MPCLCFLDWLDVASGERERAAYGFMVDRPERRDSERERGEDLHRLCAR